MIAARIKKLGKMTINKIPIRVKQLESEGLFIYWFMTLCIGENRIEKMTAQKIGMK